MTRTLTLLLTACLAATVAQAQQNLRRGQSIVDLAVASPNLSTLVTALKAADLVDTLSGGGPFTVFAPTNAAFAALQPGVLDNLLKPENKAQLVDLLTYHVAVGDAHAKDLMDMQMLITEEGKRLTVRTAGSDIFINSAKVVTADVDASNGVVHIVDAVLVPGSDPKPKNSIVDLAVATPNLSTLVTALKAADLVDTLSGVGPFTVFAPTNAAFAALQPGVLDYLLKPENKAQLVDLLTYHVASADAHAKDLMDMQMLTTVEGKNVTVRVAGNGTAIFINSAKVTTADVGACNGIVHIIDAVLMPGDAPKPAGKSIVDLAVADPDLSTLVMALKAADLVNTLSGAGPFTVFAPTNEAFAALPKGVLANLLKPKNKAQLVDLLTYHVASGEVHKKDLMDMQMLTTVEGKNVTVRVDGNDILINSAKVTTADDDASNGVVHIIDAVLMPGDAPKPASTCSVHHNMAMSADFYKNVKISQSACCSLCSRDSRCRTAVYSPKGECHLHDATDSAHPFADRGWMLMTLGGNVKLAGW